MYCIKNADMINLNQVRDNRRISNKKLSNLFLEF